jgi:transposase
MNRPMWTATTRVHHMRDGLRFASDVTDSEWAVLAPLLPPISPVGRRPAWPLRELVNAMFYVLRGGIPWRMLPPCCPARQTVYGGFATWRDAGGWQSINHRLVMLDRERVGRDASPSAAVIDRQSGKTTEAGGPCGYDAGKKLKGRKRHARVDTDGRALTLQVHPASVPDRDGAVPLLKASRRSFPFVELAFADTAYAAERVQSATCIAIQIVRKTPGQVGFEVHPRRWVVTACTMLPNCGPNGRQRSIAAFCASRAGVSADQAG